MTAQSGYIIVISPIGEIDTKLLRPVSNKILNTFGCQTEVISDIIDIDFAFDPDRNQYNSTLILEKLADVAPSQTLKLLAITNADLFIPILTYVYGEAQLDGKTSIISTCRLNEGFSSLCDEDTFLQRVVKEAIHELGHTFNLRHCNDKACIMHYCRSINDVDGKSDQLCRYCTILLKDKME